MPGSPVRDLKFLAEHPDPRNRVVRSSRSGWDASGDFDVIHRRHLMKPETVTATLKRFSANKVLCPATSPDVPDSTEARNLARRFKKHGESYIRFITTPGIEPTNNLAEQAIRFVVIDRHITQGSRSETGQRWLERIWTIIATCTQQGCSVFDFLLEAVRASFHGEPAPALIPDTTGSDLHAASQLR